jgi:hypothetical protein
MTMSSLEEMKVASTFFMISPCVRFFEISIVGRVAEPWYSGASAPGARLTLVSYTLLAAHETCRGKSLQK